MRSGKRRITRSAVVNNGVPYQWTVSTWALYRTAGSAPGAGGVGAGDGDGSGVGSGAGTGAGVGAGAGTGAGAGDGAGAGGGVAVGPVMSVGLTTGEVGPVGPPPQPPTRTDSAATTNVLQHNSLRTLHLGTVECIARAGSGSAAQVAALDYLSCSAFSSSDCHERTPSA